MQDALVRAWRDLPGLRDPERFDAWLRRLTVNACLDLARRRQRRRVEVELPLEVGPPVGDIAGAVANRDLLERALRELDPERRALIVLHYYLGMPLPDVADALQLPLGTAKSRLHRSLDTMRAVIDGDERPSIPTVAGGQVA